MQVVGPFQTSPATGGAGTATGTVTSTQKITGIIKAVYLQYLDSPPAGTTDVTIATQGSASGAPPAETILAIADAATSGWFYPKTASHLNTTGAALASEYSNGVPVDDLVVFTIAQANNDDYIKVWLMVE